MMKKQAITTVVALTILVIGAVGWFVFKSKQPPASPTNFPRIAATIFPVKDMASNITGDQMDVMTILPPGASPHTFEPTPELIRSLQNAQIIFAIGHGLDNWINRLITELPNAKIVYLDQGIKLLPFEHGADEHETASDGLDPHYWLSGQNSIIITKNITQSLSETFPEKKLEFEQNAIVYEAKLASMDQEIQNQLQSSAQKQLITHHHSWGYFAKTYGLQIIGSFEAEPGNPPTPTQLAELQSLVEEYNISTIFIEPQLPEALVKPFADDLNIKIRTLDPIGGVPGRMNYIECMKYNAQTIANAL